jgi:hypothetical protein
MVAKHFKYILIVVVIGRDIAPDQTFKHKLEMENMPELSNN